MNIAVEKSVKIEDGIHQGAIIDVHYRTVEPQKYQYTDVIIEVQGINRKVGYPTKMMRDSSLGLLMARFGHVVSEGLMLDPDQLIGRACEFITLTKPNKSGKQFSNIIPESLKPANAIPVQPQQTTEKQAELPPMPKAQS